MKTVSLIIPAYNEEASLPLLYNNLCEFIAVQTQYNWEILFINDGSTDKTTHLIDSFIEQDKRVAVVELSRNFGKEAAMLAGFDYVMGDCAIVLDADLQHPLSAIPEMLKYWEEGYDDIFARRRSRGDASASRKAFSRLYYSLLQRTSDIDVLPDVGDFRLLDRKCIDTLKQLREQCRYTKGMYAWIGFRKKEILCDQQERMAGTSKWNFFSLLNLAIEGIDLILGYTLAHFVYNRKYHLVGSLCLYDYHHSQDSHMGRAGGRLSIVDVYHPIFGWHTTTIIGYYWRILRSHIQRNQEPPHLHCKAIQETRWYKRVTYQTTLSASL